MNLNYTVAIILFNTLIVEAYGGCKNIPMMALHIVLGIVNLILGY